MKEAHQQTKDLEATTCIYHSTYQRAYSNMSSHISSHSVTMTHNTY